MKYGLSEKELERVLRMYEYNKRYNEIRRRLLSVIWKKIDGLRGLEKSKSLKIELNEKEIKEILMGK